MILTVSCLFLDHDLGIDLAGLDLCPSLFGFRQHLDKLQVLILNPGDYILDALFIFESEGLVGLINSDGA